MYSGSYFHNTTYDDDDVTNFSNIMFPALTVVATYMGVFFERLTNFC